MTRDTNTVIELKIKIHEISGLSSAMTGETIIEPRVSITISVNGEEGGTLNFDAHRAAWFIAWMESINRYDKVQVLFEWDNLETRKRLAELYVYQQLEHLNDSDFCGIIPTES